jgi:alkylation response protein AidB-like acyl-CoA dehydrogenase
LPSTCTCTGQASPPTCGVLAIESLAWLLRGAAAGEVFAAGHAEPGNDFPVLLSTTRAERVDGGCRFFGHKFFGSLTPVWTFLGVHGMDTSDPDAPKVIHAFLPRAAHGYTIKQTWDTLGMRATRSDDTILDGAFVPDEYVARIVPAGAGGVDQFVLGIFAWTRDRVLRREQDPRATEKALATPRHGATCGDHQSSSCFSSVPR